jgi:hypothetical protein
VNAGGLGAAGRGGWLPWLRRLAAEAGVRVGETQLPLKLDFFDIS